MIQILPNFGGQHKNSSHFSSKKTSRLALVVRPDNVKETNSLSRYSVNNITEMRDGLSVVSSESPEFLKMDTQDHDEEELIPDNVDVYQT